MDSSFSSSTTNSPAPFSLPCDLSHVLMRRMYACVGSLMGNTPKGGQPTHGATTALSPKALPSSSVIVPVLATSTPKSITTVSPKASLPLKVDLLSLPCACLTSFCASNTGCHRVSPHLSLCTAHEAY
jgi:hypothetical protein